jgi:hypothetical protein
MPMRLAVQSFGEAAGQFFVQNGSVFDDQELHHG